MAVTKKKSAAGSTKGDRSLPKVVKLPNKPETRRLPKPDSKADSAFLSEYRKRLADKKSNLDYMWCRPRDPSDDEMSNDTDSQETGFAADDPVALTLSPNITMKENGQFEYKKPELTPEEYESLERGYRPPSISDSRMSEIFRGRAFGTLTTTERKACLDGKDPGAATMAFKDMIENPWDYGDQIVRVTDDYIVARDKFPKSTLHWLLMPRELKQDGYHFRPLQLLSEDPSALQRVRQWADLVLDLAANQLEWMHGPVEDEQAIQKALRHAPMIDDREMEAEALPRVKKSKGKKKKQTANEYWKSQIMVGIHSNPSMAHLHIHIISVDRYSKDLKMRNHYNSFQTPFMVHLNELPLPSDDPRLDKKKAHEFLEADLQCWKCKKRIAKSTGKRTDMTKMKMHLEDEFRVWRQEWRYQ